MMDGERPVIIDFDSCKRKGDELGLKAGTSGWAMEGIIYAKPENDYLCLSKIREFMMGGEEGKPEEHLCPKSYLSHYGVGAMDPLTAISLAGNILTFIDISYNVISGVNKVLSTANGMTPENERLSVLVEDLSSITQDLVTDIPAQTENEKQLCALAANCHSLSGELYQILRRLRVGDKKSKWEGLVVKWHSMRKEKEIDSIERRLHGYQSQILIRLQVMFSQKTDEQNSLVNRQLEALRSEGKALQNQSTTQLDELYQTISTLVNSLQSAPGQDKSHGSQQGPLAKLGASLFEFQTVTTSISRGNKILELLAFKSMYSREDSIGNAESGTFEWMVDEKSQSVDDPSNPPLEPEEMYGEGRREKRWLRKQESLRKCTREEFLTWLDSGRYIFHISGKAGSGKSTLMKFLSESSRVKKRLESWAEGRPLIFARFFFWNSGDKTQMSLEGLYRSLLFETCRQMPILIPRLFPELWASSNTGVTQIRFHEVRDAFTRLIKEESSSECYFCFFIDGLDEFEGDEVDHWRLSRDLQTWTTQAKNMKLCVSSRPHIPFVQSFANDLNHQVSIHELTRDDISKFSMAMFENDPNFDRIKDSYENLVIEIVNSSDGVFLWARLVVRSLLKSIGYHGSEKDLERKLHLMPKGLDELFDQILGSIDPDDQLLSDQLFLLTTPDFCQWQPIVLNAIAYSWLEDLEDPGFPYELPMQPCKVSEINERLERVSCTLDRLSRGMLEMSPQRSREKDGHDYFTYQVQFLHRSAREYIVNTREVQMRARLPDFDVYSGIFRLLLAEFKFALSTRKDMEISADGYRDGPLRMALNRVFIVMCAANEIRGYNVPSRFFEEANHIVQHHAQTVVPRTKFLSKSEIPGPKSLIFGQCLHRVTSHWLTIRPSYHSSDFLCEVVRYDLQRFLSPDLMSRLKQQNSKSGSVLLLTAAIRPKDLGFVRDLLHEGHTPREMVNLELIPAIYKSNVKSSTTIPATQDSVSVWLIFLYWFIGQYFLGHSTTDTENQCLEEFLQYDVDRNVLFVMKISSSSDKPSEPGDDDQVPERKSGESEERLVFDLPEFLELVKPSNIETLRTKLSNKGTREDRLEVTPISGPPIPHRRGSLSKALEPFLTVGNTRQHVAFGNHTHFESAITPSERLDVPFAFRIS
ncbi:uncharacterized protein PGRI_058770 [Penicillium griseofulvum]|uniref:Uncharacterized protein n=1 Tax=Penicillium patulum TaxID=5078 RepID=A0A135LLR0_PENPA|nr:uncharacterized protein PGRI_058770 [Penicillium griseofulvum]KXG49909.1 hypothetical protein PGRI_058770 [Penicillium griseofulvum]